MLRYAMLVACIGSYNYETCTWTGLTLLINFALVTSAPYKHYAIILLFTIVCHNRVATTLAHLYSPLQILTGLLLNLLLI
jgi:hypothetical protein